MAQLIYKLLAQSPNDQTQRNALSAALCQRLEHLVEIAGIINYTHVDFFKQNRMRTAISKHTSILKMCMRVVHIPAIAARLPADLNYMIPVTLSNQLVVDLLFDPIEHIIIVLIIF